MTLARRPDASPAYRELLTADDAVQFHAFGTKDDQATWVAQQIKHNLTEDELDEKDIGIILADPLTAKKEAARLIGAFDAQGLSAHLAGVTGSVDILFEDGSIAITGIFRAKGNEAPMLYSQCRLLPESIYPDQRTKHTIHRGLLSDVKASKSLLPFGTGRSVRSQPAVPHGSLFATESGKWWSRRWTCINRACRGMQRRCGRLSWIWPSNWIVPWPSRTSTRVCCANCWRRSATARVSNELAQPE